MLSSNICSTCPDNMVNFGPLAAEIGSLVWGTPADFNGFRVLASLLQRRRSTEANQTYTIFDRLLGWYTIYTFSGALVPLRNFVWCKIHFAFKSCALLFWQCYCTALQTQPNFAALSRGRHLYSAGRPSRWALANILVFIRV